MSGGGRKQNSPQKNKKNSKNLLTSLKKYAIIEMFQGQRKLKERTLSDKKIKKSLKKPLTNGSRCDIIKTQ